MALIKRCCGIVFGAANQILFVCTVVQLYRFLNGGHEAARSGSTWIDLLLALQFAVPHSLLLWPPVRSRLGKWIPGPFFGSAFCAISCLSLLLLFSGWRSDGWRLWDTHGTVELVLRGAHLLSWSALFYSLWLSGLSWQTGWSTWYAWLRHRSGPRRRFLPRSWYLRIRHPIYLSFLGLIWFTPRMTLDHAVLTVTWTVYVFVGSRLKDARMEHFLGDVYREYESRVPGYPFMLFGPLGRRAFKPATVEPIPVHRAAA